MAYERRLENNLFELRDDLLGESYRHGFYDPFTVHDPKERRIHKATVKDRVVHQAVVNVIEPMFERRFIFDSFSCRIGKGTHAAVDRTRTFLRQASNNNTRTVYALKCDIRKFFASVDHAILFSLLARRIGDTGILRLLAHIIKSFSVSQGKGIPLGNITSQLFANVYLHELDWFVKHALREQCYIRYCDDFIFVHPSRQHLLALISRIEEFLSRHLSLHLHPDKVIVRSWTQGIDFLGYVILPHCTILRTKTKLRMLQRINSSNLSSYLGLCSHAASYHLQKILLCCISK